MSSGPESLAPWANVAFEDEIEDVLRGLRAQGVKWPEMTRLVNVAIVDYWVAREKVPPREVSMRTVKRWCDFFGIGDD